MPQPYHERLNYTMALPLRVIDHGTCGPKMVLPHWHNSVELAYAYRGKPGTVHIGNSTFEMQDHHLYVINSEVVHSYETYLDEDNQIVTLLLPAAWLRNVVEDEQLPIWGPLDLDLRTDPYRDLGRAVDTLATNAVTEPDQRADYLASLGAEYQLVGQLLKHLQVNGQVNNDQLPLPKPLRQAVTEIQEQYGTAFSIAALAERLNYSSVYFSRFFKEYMGVAPKAYLGQIRLERATELLMTSQDSIQTIATKTGFRTEKNFFVTFKQHFQMTPMTYRERYAAQRAWS
ncbi:AraC family transcriptional regulator [Levilactobacillus huananensis]|uniref:AraC family transcriptional regulator n=1 Tax=Levilactobacillus huananensis TaxID=2486019 RepID=UPI000F787C5D|nr:AraC family transcriptional regulator [Levilactobacillus huananensis]